MHDKVKPFLFLLPSQHKYSFNDQVKREIRKTLLLSVSDNGKYLDSIFPELLDPHEQLEKDLNWELSEYVKLLATTKRGDDVQAHFATHPNRPCSRVFRRGEPIIRCLTCAFDQSCALCSYCYEPSEHVGHDISIQICVRDNGGVCDCGDSEAWKASSKCANSGGHYGNFNQSLPSEFQSALSRTFGTVLDFIIDVLMNTNMQFTSASDISVETVKRNFELSTLSPHKYGLCSEHLSDKSNGKFFLQVYNDQVKHFRDAVQRVRLASGKSKEFVNMVTERAHKFGKAEVLVSSDVRVLLERQKILSATGLASAIRSARDVFRESMVYELISWLSDFTESEFFRLNYTAENSFAQAFCEIWRSGLLNVPEGKRVGNRRAGVMGDEFSIPKITSEKHQTMWLEEGLQNSIGVVCECCGNSEIGKNLAVGSRLQYLMFLNLRLWKAARELSHIMYSTSLVTNIKFKQVMSSQYMEMYIAATDQFLSLDREPEFNIMFSLSMQLFASQRNSEAIIEQGSFVLILSAIFVFLTSETISEQTLNNTSSHEISLKSLRNRRWGQLFLDLGFIISRGKDTYDISNKDNVHAVCELMSLFQGRSVIKREKNNHIEYENPDYATFFNSVQVIYKFGELSSSTLSSRSYDERTRQETALSTVEYVIEYLMKLERHQIMGLNYANTDINFPPSGKYLMEPITQKYIKASDIGKDNVSFLHPLHSYLCSLIEKAQFHVWDGLVERFARVRSNMGLPDSFFIESLVFDYPIKTLALMSQIKCGYWVRNGFTVKSQLHMYKNTGLRDYGYMKDLFLLQIFSSMCQPNLVAFTILDRWLLQGDWNLSYDAQILPSILEECVTMFIHLMTEHLSLKGLDDAELAKIRIEREIIHHLCFKPLSYKTLCSYISEKSVLDKRFELILNRMSKFTRPVGNNDAGVLELKEEYLSEVDPYYFGYTTNTRDDAIKLVKERIHRETGEAMDNIVIQPNIDDDGILDIYKYCGNVSVSTDFVIFLIKVLHFVSLQEFDKIESLLETTLHLIHVCAMQRNINTHEHLSFRMSFMSSARDVPFSIWTLLGKFLLDDKYRTVHAKIRAIFRKLEISYSALEQVMSQQSQALGLESIDFNKENKCNTEDAILKKKKLAKARQLKLLNKFKKQQSQFLAQHSDSAAECSDAEMDEDQVITSPSLDFDHCILCQNTNDDPGPFGIIAHIGNSSTFRTVPFGSEYWFLKSFSDPANLNGDGRAKETSYSETWRHFMTSVKEQSPFGPGFDSIDNIESKVTASSCGHGMHFKCYLDYLDGIRARQSQVTRNTPENPESKEILCPLCKAVNNVFIPTFNSRRNQSMYDVLPSHQHHNHHPIDDDQISQLIASKGSGLKDSYILANSKWLGWFNKSDKEICTAWKNVANSIAPIIFPRSVETALPIILSNTIKSSEIALRGAESNGAFVFEQVPRKSLVVMKALNEMCLLMQFQAVGSHYKINEDALAKVIASIMSLTTTGVIESIMEADFMDLLVEATQLPHSNISFNDVLGVTFVGHVIQCLYILTRELKTNILMKKWRYGIHDVPLLPESDPPARMEVLRCVEVLGGRSIIAQGGNIGDVLYAMLVKAVTPFLRRASIYAFLRAFNADSTESNGDCKVWEADGLCTVMKIPTVSQTLKHLTNTGTWEGEVLQNFATTYTSATHKQLVPNPKLEYPGILRLIDLPDRLDEFFTGYYYSEKFGKPYQSIEDPAICMVCGTVVDLQKQAFGTTEGQCTAHYSRECGSQDGIFFLPKDRAMLLLHNYKGSFHSAPYLDDQGELADENKKGRVLHLMPTRYNDFVRHIWLENNVANCIARNLESVLDPGGWETL
ncbi:hypothetical protein KGF57_004795 [Candida theae]|uniref:E3 ubiquitin-protein ligase n=1 Tax=Candida theae TaxID=1198502 RepID=A0AAD5FWK8_9ASCO|nr:uncharacterized protein KGF57_004795 [Candida theae]KAI5949197.1 hypothetical protein KGF57_004795 [Candida theae]